eukprot:gnl/TRDRNA2_/TRDRNA2_175296_c0_seq2.p1 gnl/TRDRNA2_/TRDRNA2_175296_c0~~gnl/TRDRNA2_/TRDRNA2_175296_c0_seq2.p1  ORF type:complete len:299 (+),score=27.90 gnl/TRDRNA2_/TRDRNA2_175296_c0_seq2:510-1406(+)
MQRLRATASSSAQGQRHCCKQLAFYAESRHGNASVNSYVHARAPYYPEFKLHTEAEPLARWAPNLSLPARDVIEFVTIPNNPDGKTYAPEYPDARLVTDLVYYWPSMTPNIEKRSDNIMIFSLNKMTGYAASRFGWALVKDQELAMLMGKGLQLWSGGGPAVESMLRAAKAMRAVIQSLHTPNDFFAVARAMLKERWQRLQSAFQQQTTALFSLEETVPGALFAWVKCSSSILEKYGTCISAFAAANLVVNEGMVYAPETGHAYVRMCIGGYDPTFELLIDRVEKLMSPRREATLLFT